MFIYDQDEHQNTIVVTRPYDKFTINEFKREIGIISLSGTAFNFMNRPLRYRLDLRGG